MDSRPDALMIPKAFAAGQHLKDKMNNVLDVAEPLLGVDRAAGEKAWIRRQPGEVMFVTRDPHDTIHGAVGTPGEGRPRYRWEPSREDGIAVGYLA